MYLCRKLTGCSFPAIGAGFNRNHSTVIHACDMIADRIKNDPAFGLSINKIEQELKPARTHAWQMRNLSSLRTKVSSNVARG
jgi:hypothetical protein